MSLIRDKHAYLPVYRPEEAHQWTSLAHLKTWQRACHSRRLVIPVQNFALKGQSPLTVRAG